MRTVVDYAEIGTEDFSQEQVEAKLNELVGPYGVTGRVLVLNGPGGGWPEVELEGSEEALTKVLKVEWDYDDEDLAGEGLPLIQG